MTSFAGRRGRSECARSGRGRKPEDLPPPAFVISYVSADLGFTARGVSEGSFRLAPELRLAQIPPLSNEPLMKSRAAIAGHPLHPIFVTLPIGLWSFAPVCDLIYHAGWGDDSWKKAAFYCLIGGIVGAVPAIITGLIDYPLAKNPSASKVVTFHLIFNSLAVLLVALSVWLRWSEFPSAPGVFARPNAGPETGAYHLLPVGISLAAVMVTGISGWLGGELVSRFGISVHEDALRRGAREPDGRR